VSNGCCASGKATSGAAGRLSPTVLDCPFLSNTPSIEAYGCCDEDEEDGEEDEELDGVEEEALYVPAASCSIIGEELGPGA
jgi:hypothetical protein